MKNFKRYTVTAALPYANGGIHLGHLAGAYLPADIYVRYRRLKGDDVLFICGSDEHGVPITLGARKEGISPQQFVDKYHELMKSSFAEFGISFDIYSRTSNKIHHETAQEIFLDLYTKNIFTEETSLQYYDEKEKMFLADRYIQGTCPNCGYEKAYGDQCERCGTSLSPKDLINPVSVLSGNAPVMKETKHWYLPLQNYEPWLREWILKEHKDDPENVGTGWKTNVYGQCKSWLDNGLQPRAMTRDLEWGVKVPLPNTEGKVLYVWFDAPIGYISATKEFFKYQESRNKNQVESHSPSWEDYWKSPDTKLLHFIGKDNIVFHCIIFPAILHAHGEYIVPDNVPAMEFLNLEGEKLSTSRNWAVWLHEYLKDFPGKQDELRYVLTSILPETSDSDFSWKDFQARINNELADNLGNFVNRTLVLARNYCDNKVPQHGSANDSDRICIEAMKQAPELISAALEDYQFREALTELMNLARVGNKYLADNEPWKLIKTDEVRVKTILYVALEITTYLAALSEPFLPNTSAKIFSMLNLQKRTWDEMKGKILEPGHQLGDAKLLFEKIEDEQVQFQVDKLHSTKDDLRNTTKENRSQSGLSRSSRESPNPILESTGKSEITYDDFSKLELKVGTIEAAEKVKKADKLLQLTINLGDEVRTVVSGIAEHYSPENIIGQQVCMVANLAPRKIKGIESKGMILMAEDENGKLKFVMPSEKISDGSKIS
ncbi:MAG TPA: methionine--tRNA ligase [Chitinophagales bacterium]|nr:methionine--tRNA ligase [Chitinophagales bacterium]